MFVCWCRESSSCGRTTLIPLHNFLRGLLPCVLLLFIICCRPWRHRLWTSSWRIFCASGGSPRRSRRSWPKLAMYVPLHLHFRSLFLAWRDRAGSFVWALLGLRGLRHFGRSCAYFQVAVPCAGMCVFQVSVLIGNRIEVFDCSLIVDNWECGPRYSGLGRRFWLHRF